MLLLLFIFLIQHFLKVWSTTVCFTCAWCTPFILLHFLSPSLLHPPLPAVCPQEIKQSEHLYAVSTCFVFIVAVFHASWENGAHSEHTAYLIYKIMNSNFVNDGKHSTLWLLYFIWNSEKERFLKGIQIKMYHKKKSWIILKHFLDSHYSSSRLFIQTNVLIMHLEVMKPLHSYGLI